MDIRTLQSFLALPDVHRRVLSGYTGPYSLGIGEAPVTREPVLVLHVAADESESFPSQINLNGERISVQLKRDFVAPRPF